MLNETVHDCTRMLKADERVQQEREPEECEIQEDHCPRRPLTEKIEAVGR